MSNNSFKSYQSSRQHFVSIKGYDSNLKEINCSILQGSVLGPLLVLIYINYCNLAIKLCKVHHFADDTICISMMIQIDDTPLVNNDLKNLVS